MSLAVVNGKKYSWSDLTISLIPLSPVLFSISEISWDEELESEAIYGKGNMPTGYGTGNWKGTGKLSLDKEEFDALTLIALPFGGILALDPRITLINLLYLNDDGIAPANDETLRGIKFTKISNARNQGDKGFKVSLDFIMLEKPLNNGISSF